jgi:hypothetical protein
MAGVTRAVARVVGDGALVNVTAHPLHVGPSLYAFMAAADGMTESESDGDGPRAVGTVKLPAPLLFERLDIDGSIAAKFGPDALETLRLDQMQGGSNDGMFVAHDGLVVLMNMRTDAARRKVMDVVLSKPEPCSALQIEENRKKQMDFPSCKVLKWTGLKQFKGLNVSSLRACLM